MEAEAHRVAGGVALRIGVVDEGEHRAVAERDAGEGAGPRDDGGGGGVGPAVFDRGAERALAERAGPPARLAPLFAGVVVVVGLPGLVGVLAGLGAERDAAARVDEVAAAGDEHGGVAVDDAHAQRRLGEAHGAPGGAGVEGGERPPQIGVDDGAPAVGEGEHAVAGG